MMHNPLSLMIFIDHAHKGVFGAIFKLFIIFLIQKAAAVIARSGYRNISWLLSSHTWLFQKDTGEV